MSTWSPTPTAPVTRGGKWSPTPEAPVSTPGMWRTLAVRFAHDLGTGHDQATARALATAHDLGTGHDQATAQARTGATDLGAAHDRAVPRARASAHDLGVGGDRAAGRLRGTTSGDLGHGYDNATIRAARGTARDLGVGTSRAAGRARATARDLGRGQDQAAGRWLDRWSGSRGSLTIDLNDWEYLLTFTATGNTTGLVNFSVTHSWGKSALQWVSVKRRLRITINGAQVGSYAQQSHTTGSWSTTSTWTGVSVTAGATIRVEGWSECAYPGPRTVTVSAASMTVVSI